MESTQTLAKLKLKTKGFCFLCLQEQNDPLQDIKMEPDSNSPLTLFSYQSLLQFLDMDRKKILVNLCAPVESLKILEKAELVVQVCSQCNSITQQFLDLHKQLKIIQKGLNSILHKIHDVMEDAEEDQTVLEYFKEKMTCGNDGMLHSKLIHNLRRETMEKCLNKINGTTTPGSQVSELGPSKSSSLGKATLSQRSLSAGKGMECSYCPAKSTAPRKYTERRRLQLHLNVHHCEQLFKEYKNPTITPYHFKVCCALLFQNISESEKGFHCPYCPYIYSRKSSGTVKSLLFPHIMETHKDELLLRLQDLQRKDQDELLQMHHDSGGKSCYHCGDLLYSLNVLNSHIKNYCLKVKNPGTSNPCMDRMNYKKYDHRGNLLHKISNKYKNVRPESKFISEGMEIEEATKSNSISEGITEEVRNSKRRHIQCPHCHANIVNDRKFALRNHLFTFHFDKHMADYKLPSVSSQHFKVCAGLVLQNVGQTETHLVCPYCPYNRIKTSKIRKGCMFGHVVDNHKDKVIQRLQELQKLDMNTLMNSHGGDKGRTCVNCRDFFPSQNSWRLHATSYCRATVKRKTEAESGSSNKKVKLNESSDSEVSSVREGRSRRAPFQLPGVPVVPKCSYCTAKFQRSQHHRLQNHLYMYHCDQLFKEYKNPTVTPSHFKVCCALLLQNCYSDDEGVHCPYCSYVYQLTGVVRKSGVFPHMVSTHKDEVILRLQDLQKKDEEELLRIHRDSGGKICEKCGDFMQSPSMLAIHVHNYCLKYRRNLNKCECPGGCGSRPHNGIMCERKKASVLKSTDSKSKDESVPEPVRTTIIIKRVSRSMPPTVHRKIIKCSICGEDYSDPASLQKHKSTHTPASIKNLNFPCSHCPQVFKFYFTLRAHLIKSHPFIMFQKNLPPETESEEVIEGLKSLVHSLNASQAHGANVKFSCKLCTKEYADFEEFESHILVAHFDEIKVKLRKLIMKSKNESEPIVEVKIESEVESEENM